MTPKTTEVEHLESIRAILHAIITVRKFRLGKRNLVQRYSDLSPNSLVDHQMLVVYVQNAYKIKLGCFELLELSFGSVDPIFFNNHQVDVLVNPNVGFVTRFIGILLAFLV